MIAADTLAMLRGPEVKPPSKTYEQALGGFVELVERLAVDAKRRTSAARIARNACKTSVFGDGPRRFTYATP